MKIRSLTAIALLALITVLSGCVVRPTGGYTAYYVPARPSPMIAYQPVYIVPAPTPYYVCPPRTTIQFGYAQTHRRSAVWFNGQWISE